MVYKGQGRLERCWFGPGWNDWFTSSPCIFTLKVCFEVIEATKNISGSEVLHWSNQICLPYRTQPNQLLVFPALPLFQSRCLSTPGTLQLPSSNSLLFLHPSMKLPRQFMHLFHLVSKQQKVAATRRNSRNQYIWQFQERWMKMKIKDKTNSLYPSWTVVGSKSCWTGFFAHSLYRKSSVAWKHQCAWPTETAQNLSHPRCSYNAKIVLAILIGRLQKIESNLAPNTILYIYF